MASIDSELIKAWGAECVLPPASNSIYNVIVRRLRMAGTIFGDRIKLDLRPSDAEHWTKLDKPYLLLVPQQNRSPQRVDIDYPSFVNPRVVSLVAQFEDCNTEASWIAANAIDMAERQLVYVLTNWQPPGASNFSHYRPTSYGGMRIQSTRAPDVKVVYQFVFNEEVVLDEPPIIDINEIPFGMEVDRIAIRINGPCCPEENPPGNVPNICVDECPSPPEPPCDPPCPPILGGDPHGSTSGSA